MADYSVFQLSLIQQEINARETLSTYLCKAEALAHIFADFLGNPAPIHL